MNRMKLPHLLAALFIVHPSSVIMTAINKSLGTP